MKTAQAVKQQRNDFERGLMVGMSIVVAPRAGAWIETSQSAGVSARRMSRPARARGLKRRHID